MEKKVIIVRAQDLIILTEPKPIKEEDGIDYKGLVNEICCWLMNNENTTTICLSLIFHLINIGYDKKFIYKLFDGYEVEL